MRLYLNDLSLAKQFDTTAAFVIELNTLLNLRERSQFIADILVCSRDIHLRHVTGLHTFQDAVIRSGDKGLLRRVLSWVTKSGPFLDNERHIILDDYFEHQNSDVTDTALGEAARATLLGTANNLISFKGGGFDYRPIPVQHGIPEDVLGNLNLNNEWNFSLIRNIVFTAIPPPINWHQMLDQSINKFEHLRFSPECIEHLLSEPFSSYVVERFFELCKTLDEYAGILSEFGKPTTRSNEIIAQHFSGEKAWFTDESDTNKKNFADKLLFNNLNGIGKTSCPWHGKIKTPQYRLHFKWPINPGDCIEIFYIGPKLTKK